MSLHLWTYLECLQLRGHFVLGGEILFEGKCMSLMGISVHSLLSQQQVLALTDHSITFQIACLHFKLDK